MWDYEKADGEHASIEKSQTNQEQSNIKTAYRNIFRTQDTENSRFVWGRLFLCPMSISQKMVQNGTWPLRTS